MKSFKNYWKTTKEVGFRILRFLGSHPFVLFVVIFLAGLLSAAFLFFDYMYLPQQAQIQLPESKLKFQEETFQGIVDEWVRRELSSQASVSPRDLFLEIPEN